MQLDSRKHVSGNAGAIQGWLYLANRNRFVFKKNGRLEHELTDESNTGL
jgi:hypothetical protein